MKKYLISYCNNMQLKQQPNPQLQIAKFIDYAYHKTHSVIKKLFGG